MVNTDAFPDIPPRRVPELRRAAAVVGIYVGLTVATVVALILMSFLAPDLATGDAWGHAVIVVVFAVLLPVRMRAARNGSARAVRAVLVIAAVVCVVNVVEASLPHEFPDWMRIEMIVIAVLMAALVAVLAGYVRRSSRRAQGTLSRLR